MTLAHVKAFLLDLDGTLYVSGKLIPAAKAFFNTLKERHIPFLCLTNNSSASTLDYVNKLNKMGISVKEENILTSGQAALFYVKEETSYKSAYVLGTKALCDEFKSGGIHLEDDDPDCLVVGYDTELTYEKLSIATRLLFADKPYIATHPDLTCISDQGLLPDIAATIEGLYTVTKKRPLIVGKPEAYIIKAAAKRLNVDIESLAMVGDQLDTDMTMAINFGLTSILMLSGETSKTRLEQSSLRPDYVFDDIGGLNEALNK